MQHQTTKASPQEHATEFQATEIGDIKVANLNYKQAVDIVTNWAKSREQRYVCTCNAHSATSNRWTHNLKVALQHADLNAADGMPLVWLQRHLGYQNASRVHGPTLMFEVLKRAVREKLRIALYGGHPEQMPRLLEKLQGQIPGLQIVAAVTPPSRTLTRAEDTEFTQELIEAKPHITFVGMGCPYEETWMHQHRKAIPGVMLGVGAAFDFNPSAAHQARVRRKHAGIGWAFQSTMSPKRLFKDSLQPLPALIQIGIKQLLHSKLKGINYQHNIKPDDQHIWAQPAASQHWAICIATYKRPNDLKNLIHSIENAHLPAGINFELRIVDNDADASAREAVMQFRQRAHMFTQIHYEVESRQNIAHARNKAIEMGAADAFIFVDDDEFVDKDWLIGFADATSAAPNAAGFFGPVYGKLEECAPYWMHQGGFFDKPVGADNGRLNWKQTRTSNTLVRGNWLLEKNYRFDPLLGRSGGSDTDLFARMSSKGATYVACSKAVVFEHVPSSRANFGWLWSRQYRNGLIFERNARRTANTELSPFKRILTRLAAIPTLLVVGLPGLICGTPELFMRGILKVPLLFGGIIAAVSPCLLYTSPSPRDS